MWKSGWLGLEMGRMRSSHTSRKRQKDGGKQLRGHFLECISLEEYHEFQCIMLVLEKGSKVLNDDYHNDLGDGCI